MRSSIISSINRYINPGENKAKGLSVLIAALMLYCSCSNSSSTNGTNPGLSTPDSFAVRMPASATKITQSGTISRNRLFNIFFKSAYASDDVEFPSFTFSTEDNLGDSLCSGMDYYSSSWNRLALSPISDLDSNGTKTIKLVKDKTYHLFISGYITSTDNIHYCNSSSSGSISCSKAGTCNYGGRFVTGNWKFTVSNTGDSQVEILSQATSGNVYLKATNPGLDKCTITAEGEALDPSYSDGTVMTITISKDITVVENNTTAPSVSKIEFSGQELPLNSVVEIDFDALTYYSTGEKPDDYASAAPADCSSGDCVPFKIYGENITNCYWTTPFGTLGGTGIEYYWRASTSDSVFGVLVSTINSDNVLVQDKILVKKIQQSRHVVK